MPQPRFYRLTTLEGFIDVFYEVIKEQQCTHREAYDILIQEYHQATGRYRYASYESFKAAKSRFNKN